LKKKWREGGREGWVLSKTEAENDKLRQKHREKELSKRVSHIKEKFKSQFLISLNDKQ